MKAAMTNGSGAEMSDSALKAPPNGQASRRSSDKLARVPTKHGIRVFVAAENRLLREALARVLRKRGNIEVIETNSTVPFRADSLQEVRPDILVLTSRGTLSDDLVTIQEARAAAPEMRILLIGMGRDEREFLQCVRAGISGYLLRDASADDVLEGVRAVKAGEAVCPGALCAALFRYFQSDAASLTYGSDRRRLGLSRREQQLIPLIAKGLTNKEIATHFSLSEQTVKNHLYRMKNKVGAEDRLELVQMYRMQGFPV
jgi:DNA-binding NarL/FixJ family response regulator